MVGSTHFSAASLAGWTAYASHAEFRDIVCVDLLQWAEALLIEGAVQHQLVGRIGNAEHILRHRREGRNLRLRD